MGERPPQLDTAGEAIGFRALEAVDDDRPGGDGGQRELPLRAVVALSYSTRRLARPRSHIVTRSGSHPSTLGTFRAENSLHREDSFSTRANPSRDGDAKPRVRQTGLIAGLPKEG